MSEIPLQDQLPEDHPARCCFGCGADNAQGLRIKSFFQDGTAICRFTPSSQHTAFPGVVNGGIIATLLDCHGIWTALGHDNRRNRPGEANPGTMYVTKRMEVDYHCPTPMDRELLLVGRVLAEGTRSMRVSVELYAGETLTASAGIVAVRAANGKP